MNAGLWLRYNSCTRWRNRTPFNSVTKRSCNVTNSMMRKDENNKAAKKEKKKRSKNKFPTACRKCMSKWEGRTCIVLRKLRLRRKRKRLSLTRQPRIGTTTLVT